MSEADQVRVTGVVVMRKDLDQELLLGLDVRVKRTGMGEVCDPRD